MEWVVTLQEVKQYLRIDFEDDESRKDIYIGLTYLTKNDDNIIYDWRSPVASVFYDYEGGDCSY